MRGEDAEGLAGQARELLHVPEARLPRRALHLEGDRFDDDGPGYPARPHEDEGYGDEECVPSSFVRILDRPSPP